MRNTSEATGHGQLNSIQRCLQSKPANHLMIVGQIIHGI